MIINSRRIGDGPEIVMIHGLFGSLENLATIAQKLSHKFSVYSIDLPNHGRSGHCQASSLSEFSSWVETWLDEQGIENAHFWGHSLGGKVAMEVAMVSPERVNNLLVADISPVQYANQHQNVFSGLNAILPAQITQRKQADDILAAYVPEPEVRSFLLKNLERYGGQYRWRFNLASLERGYNELVHANTQGLFAGKTLFLKGQNSTYISSNHRDDVIMRFPKAEMKVIANAGHWLHAQYPDQVARISERFFSIP